MGNVLGWFGLKKPQPSPKAARRDRSPPLQSEKPKCQDGQQFADSCTSSQSDEDFREPNVGPPPKLETPASVSKPVTVAVQSSPKQEQNLPPARPPVPKGKIEEPSKPIEISSKTQENVQSLANIAKEEVRNLTDSISKTSVDTTESLVKITSSTSRTTSSVQEPTPPSEPSVAVSQVQTRTAASIVKSAEPFEIVSVCPVVAVCPPLIDEIETESEDPELNQETAEEAAVKIQAGIRGYLTRKALKDRFSPAPESLIEKQTETSQTKPDSETANTTSKTTSKEVQETPIKLQGTTDTKQTIIASKSQEAPVHGQHLHETRVTITNVNVACREKIPVKPIEPVKKEEASARPAGMIKTQAQPQNQIAEAVARASQIVLAEMPQQKTPSKVYTLLQEDEDEWEEEEEDDEDIVAEDEEPTPPATPPIQIKKQMARPPTPPAIPPTQIKKQMARPPGATSSTKVEKH